MKKLFTFTATLILTGWAALALAADPAHIIRLGMTTEIGGHYHLGISQFKEKVEKATNGQVRVDIFPSSQLGGERDMIEGMATGLLEMAITSSAPLANFSPEFLVFDFPFIVTDRDKAFKVMDGPIGQAILGSMDPKGVKALGFWENGFRNLTTSKGPILHPADVKGLKIRTMENPIHMATFKLLGATPTPMAMGEVFLALQQKTIDGQENPLVIIDTSKIYEANNYISLTGHFYAPAVVMVSKQIFDSYPADVQKAIIEAEKEARAWERAYCVELDGKLRKDLEAKGVIISDVDKEEWRKATLPIYKEFESRVNPAYLKAMTE